MAKEASNRPGAIQIGSAEAVVALATRIHQSVTNADAARGTYLQDIKDGRKLYDARQPRKNPPWPGACELHIPMLKYTRNQLLARTTRALLGVDPIFSVEPKKAQDREPAARVEKFLQEQVSAQVDLAGEIAKALQGALEDGVAGMYVRWQRIERERTRWQLVDVPQVDEQGNVAIDPLTMQPITTQELQPQRNAVVEYDGPELQYVNIEDFGVFPATCADLQQSEGVYVRFPQTGDDLLMMARTADYDRAAVEAMRKWSSDAEGRVTPDETAREISAVNEVNPTFQAKSFDITEVYMLYAGDEKTVTTDWLITMHMPSKTVLRAMPSPWWHGKRPFVVFRPFPDKFGIMGDSLGDLAGDLQAASTTLMRLFVDNLSKCIAPPLKVKKGAMNQTEREAFKTKVGPNAIWELDNPESIQPLDVLFHANTGIPLLEQLRMITERTTGVGDTNMGMSGRVKTATEVEQMLAEGQELFSMIIERLANPLTEIGELLIALDYQFAGNESIQAMWEQVNAEAQADQGMGMGAGMDMGMAGVPGGMGEGMSGATAGMMGDPGMMGGMEQMPMMPQLQQAPPSAVDELGMSFKISSRGVTETSNAAIRRQRAVEIYPVLMQNPLVQRDIKYLYAVTEWMINESKLQVDPVSFIGTSAEAQQWQQRQMMQQQAMMQAQAMEQQQQQAMQQQQAQEKAGREDEHANRSHELQLAQLQAKMAR